VFLRQWLKVCIIFALFVVCVYLFYQSIISQRLFPVRHIDLTVKARYLSPEQLMQQLRHDMQGSFWTLNIAQLRAQVLSNPWVDRVDMNRVWPDRLKVVVYQKEVFAYWGEDALLDRDFGVFRPVTMPKGLKIAHLAGFSDASRQDVVAMYQFMSDYFQPFHLDVVRLVRTQRGSWQCWLQDGARIELGRHDISARLERVVKFYQQHTQDLSLNHKRIKRIDCRYPNGLAVEWL